jgi:fluoride exporter
MPLLLVMLGGALGAGGRHLVGRATLGWFGPGFPYGTITVNILGGLLMGLLVGTLARIDAGENVRLFLGVGVLGGFTTFSSFSLDVVNLIDRGAIGIAAFYVLTSVVASILAVFAGLAMTRAVA